MEAEDIINLPASSDSGFEGQNKENCDIENGQHEGNSRNSNSEHGEGNVGMEEDMDLTEDDFRNSHGQIAAASEQSNDVVNDSPVARVSIELAETVTATNEKLDALSSRLSAEDGDPNVESWSPIRSPTVDASSKSGFKRARTAFDEQQPSVHVTYRYLTRASKQKLEHLLQKWSEWQAEHISTQDPDQVLESGEETYFPALRIGLQKNSSVSFWIDNQTSDRQIKGVVPMDSSTTPLYDRGFSLGLTSADGSINLEGGLEIIDDAPRCFNCGSYSHSLRDCPKPRDNATVNRAWKQHKAKKNQNPGPRLPNRYYQSSQGGKYDGLRPGTLGAETRKLLGLGELDPPPWLNRMRELGYPPGYLAPDDEDHPSGITIFGDEDVKEEKRETEDGEILERDSPPEPPKKTTVDFPGINAPIPENADERLWAPGPSNPDPYRSRGQRRSSHFAEHSGRGYLHEPRYYRDDGPPGVEPSSYPPRYGGYDNSYGPKDTYSYRRPRSPTVDRSHSDRGRRDYTSQDTSSYSRYSSSSRPRDYDDPDYWDRDDHHDLYRHNSFHR